MITGARLRVPSGPVARIWSNNILSPDFKPATICKAAGERFGPLPGTVLGSPLLGTNKNT